MNSIPLPIVGTHGKVLVINAEDYASHINQRAEEVNKAVLELCDCLFLHRSRVIVATKLETSLSFFALMSIACRRFKEIIRESVVGSPAAKHVPAQPARTTARSAVSQVAGSSPASPSPRRGAAEMIEGKLEPRRQALINALAFYSSIRQPQIRKERLAAFVGRSNDDGFRNDLGAALVASPEVPQIRRNAELHQIWRNRLEPRRDMILQVLLQTYPNSIGKDALAKAVGRSNDGGFRNDLGAMRSLGIIDYPQKGTAAASANLFPLRS